MDAANLDSILLSLTERAAQARTASDRVAIGELYDRLVEAAPRHGGALAARNRFRLAHPDCVSQDRPKVLIGGMNDGGMPNFHTIPLLRVADVVSLTLGPDEGRIDRLHYDIFADRLSDLLTRLPAGFSPDLFYDNQVMGAHPIPAGLEEAPFPTVGGLCHLFIGTRTPRVAELFDVLLPLSTPFAEGLARQTGKVVLDLPFGLNWGSFHEMIGPAAHKDIDLSCTLGPALGLGGHSPARHLLHEFMLDFATRHADRYRIEVTSGLSKAAYFDVLSRSRISLNATNFHGPYNYRTCEVMNAGALCVHVEDPGYFAVETRITDYFEADREIVSCALDELESTLLEWLEAPEQVQQVAAAGAARLERDYAYDSLYRRLFDEVAALEIDPSSRVSPARAYFALGANYWYGGRDDQLLLSALSIMGLSEQTEPVQLNNLMVIAARLIEQQGIAAVQPLFASVPGIASVFENGLDVGARAIRELAPDHPILAWNAFMLCVERGSATEAEALAVLEGLEGPIAPSAFDETLIVQPRAAYLSEPEEGQVHYGLFQHRLVATAGDTAAWGEIHVEYLRWHVHRWLHAQGEAVEGDWLPILIEAWPGDSVLQLEWARRLHVHAPEDPRIRVAYQEALRLDPLCEEAAAFLRATTAASPTPRTPSRRPFAQTPGPSA